MAERELAVVISAKDEYSATLNKFKGTVSSSASEVQGTFSRMTDGIKGSFAAVKAAWLEIAAVVAGAAWLKEAADQALENERAFSQLRFQVEALGVDFEQQRGRIEGATAAASRYAIVGENNVQAALRQLIDYSGKYEGSLQNLNLVYDLAYQKGIDQSEAAMLVGRALTGNTEALSRYLPELRNLEDKLGKHATEAQKSAYAMAVLKEKSEGALSAMTEHERMARNATKAYSEFTEKVGGLVLAIRDFLIGTFNAAAGAGLYLYGAFLKVEYGFTSLMNYLRGGDLNDKLKDLKIDIDAAFGAASELMIKAGEQQARVLGLTTAAVENETKAIKENTGAKILAAGIKQENEGFDARYQQLTLEKKFQDDLEARRIAASQSELLRNYNVNQKHLADTQMFYAQKISLMAQSGASETELQNAYAEAQIEIEREEGKMRVSLAGDTAGMLSQTAQDLNTLMGGHNRAAFEASKAFAIADATLKGYQVVMNAWKEGSSISYWYGIALAAAAAISTAAHIMRISQTTMEGSKGGSMSPGGVVNPTYSGGSSTAYAPGEALGMQQAKGAQQVNITIYNSSLTGEVPPDTIDAIVKGINDAQGRNVNLNVAYA